MKTRLKPMGARDMLDVTFTILREQFWTFQGVIFYSFLPSTIVILISLAYLAITILTLPGGLQFDNPSYGAALIEGIGTIGIIILIGLLLIAVLLLLIGSLFNLYGNIRVFHFGLHQEKCTVKQAFQGIGKKWLWYFLFFILASVITTVTLVPGIIISAMITFVGSEVLQFIVSLLINIFQIGIGFLFCLTPVVIAVEPDTDTIKAIIRAFTLLSGHRWRVLGILILTYLLGYALLMVMMAIVSTPIILAVINQNLLWIILAGIAVLAALVILSIMISYYFGPLTIIYYDLIIRKEGYDLQLQMAETTATTNLNPNETKITP